MFTFREKKRERQRVLYHIVRRKYFKPEQEANLLTWDAKEQIRYLHTEEPDVWTPEKIAQSFPISVDGVKRFLKNDYTPQNLDEVMKHDRRVQKRWRALQAGGGTDGGPLKLRYEELVATGLVQHAGGNAALPMPARDKLLPLFTPPWRQPGRQPGLFESIVKDYSDKKSAVDRQQQELAGQREWDRLRDENKVLLEHLAQSTQQQQAGSENRQKGQQLATVKHRSSQKASPEPVSPDTSGFSYMDPVLSDPTIHGSSDQSVMQPADYADLPRVTPPIRRRRRGVSQRHQIQPSDTLEELQMKGTQKLSLQQASRLSKVPYPTSEDPISKVPYTSNEVPDLQARKRQQMLEKLRYDSPGSEAGSVEEAYVYMPGDGYQHPFGRIQEDVEDVTVPEGGKHPQTVVRKGKAHYDADGEFLYKVP